MRVRVRVIDLKTGEEKNIDIEKEKTNVGISLQTCSSPPQRDRPKGFVRLFFFLLPSVGNLGNKDASDSWWYSECSPRRGGDEIIPRHLFWQ